MASVSFFVQSVLVPCLTFAVLAFLILRRKRAVSARPGGASVALLTLGFFAFAAATVYLVSGLDASDGWAGNLVLLLAFGCGSAALYCLAGLAFALFVGGVGGGAASNALAARARARQREERHRSQSKRPPQP